MYTSSNNCRILFKPLAYTEEEDVSTEGSLKPILNPLQSNKMQELDNLNKKYKIRCRDCGKPLDSILDQIHHVCLNKSKVKWITER